MARLIMDYQLAHAAAWDAGNRSMRQAGRDQWDKVDYQACVKEFERLYWEPLGLGLYKGMGGCNEGYYGLPVLKNLWCHAPL